MRDHNFLHFKNPTMIFVAGYCFCANFQLSVMFADFRCSKLIGGNNCRMSPMVKPVFGWPQAYPSPVTMYVVV